MFTYTGENVQTKPAFKVPPVADYDCQITKAEEGISKAGAKMIKLTVKLQHPEYHNELWDFIVDGPYAQQKMYEVLSACGVEPQIGQAVNSSIFIGKIAKIRIKHEDYNGEPQARVAYWRRGKATAQATVEAPKTSKHDVNEEIPF
jgi:hypothetical protein